METVGLYKKVAGGGSLPVAISHQILRLYFTNKIGFLARPGGVQIPYSIVFVNDSLKIMLL